MAIEMRIRRRIFTVEPTPAQRRRWIAGGWLLGALGALLVGLFAEAWGNGGSAAQREHAIAQRLAEERALAEAFEAGREAGIAEARASCTPPQLIARRRP